MTRFLGRSVKEELPIPCSSRERFSSTKAISGATGPFSSAIPTPSLPAKTRRLSRTTAKDDHARRRPPRAPRTPGDRAEGVSGGDEWRQPRAFCEMGVWLGATALGGAALHWG